MATVPVFILCQQCQFYHEAQQSPSTESRVKWNRFTVGELHRIHGNGNWIESVTHLTGCPSGAGPVRHKNGRRRR
jgi:hypothetical protein